MTLNRQRWPRGFAVLICLGTVAAIHAKPGADWRESTAWHFSTRLASTMQFALDRHTLLVPTSLEVLGSYRTCPSQILFHFNGHNLEQEQFLQRNEIGVMSARISLALAPYLTQQQRSDCKARSRMHPLPGWEDEGNTHKAYPPA